MQQLAQIALLTVVATILAGLVLLISLYQFYDGDWPAYPKVAMFASPFVPLLLAVFASLWYVHSDIDNNRKVFSVVFMISVIVICSLLSNSEVFSNILYDYFAWSFRGWRAHILLLGILYMIFIIWDLVFAFGGNVPEDIRRDVRQNLSFLNIPTCAALGVIYIFLGFWEKNTPLDSIYLDVSTYGFETIFDVFVSGVVAFHLTVGAIIF